MRHPACHGAPEADCKAPGAARRASAGLWAAPVRPRSRAPGAAQPLRSMTRHTTSMLATLGIRLWRSSVADEVPAAGELRLLQDLLEAAAERVLPPVAESLPSMLAFMLASMLVSMLVSMLPLTMLGRSSDSMPSICCTSSSTPMPSTAAKLENSEMSRSTMAGDACLSQGLLCATMWCTNLVPWVQCKEQPQKAP